MSDLESKCAEEDRALQEKADAAHAEYIDDKRKGVVAAYWDSGGASLTFHQRVQDLASERQRLETWGKALIAAGVDPDELEPIDGAEKAAESIKIDGTFAKATYAWDGNPKGKDSNPKDAIGSRKVGLSGLPRQVLYEVALAMLEGALKYARHNYRIAGVRASVYMDAHDRHMDAWWEGQDTDPDSGLHHVVKAIATLVVLRDSMLAGNWTDDRPPSIGDPNWIKWYNSEAERIIDAFEGEPKRPFIKGDNE